MGFLNYHILTMPCSLQTISLGFVYIVISLIHLPEIPNYEALNFNLNLKVPLPIYIIDVANKCSEINLFSENIDFRFVKVNRK